MSTLAISPIVSTSNLQSTLARIKAKQAERDAVRNVVMEAARQKRDEETAKIQSAIDPLNQQLAEARSLQQELEQSPQTVDVIADLSTIKTGITILERQIGDLMHTKSLVEQKPVESFIVQIPAVKPTTLAQREREPPQTKVETNWRSELKEHERAIVEKIIAYAEAEGKGFTIEPKAGQCCMNKIHSCCTSLDQKPYPFIIIWKGDTLLIGQACSTWTRLAWMAHDYIFAPQSHPGLYRLMSSLDEGKVKEQLQKQLQYMKRNGFIKETKKPEVIKQAIVKPEKKRLTAEQWTRKKEQDRLLKEQQNERRKLEHTIRMEEREDNRNRKDYGEAKVSMPTSKKEKNSKGNKKKGNKK
jgi:hypothetical protein